jgi:hypothetical protein
MSIRVCYGNINLNIIDLNGRNIGTIKNSFWRGQLPINGFYILEISSENSASSNYKLNIEVI